MNSKAHFRISLIKSLIRMLACAIGMITIPNIYATIVLALLFVAEVLGIEEEIYDKR